MRLNIDIYLCYGTKSKEQFWIKYPKEEIKD